MRFILSLILLLFLISLSCNSPTEPNGRFSLTLSDVSCTEAWLSLSAGSLALPVNIVVNKNGNNFFSFTLTSKDTTLYDSTLSPNQTYTYQAVYGSNKSETVTAKTMDTTSSNFTWQTFTFGGNAGSCEFYDCAIVNDTLAYAVGAIYLEDSTGKPDPLPYNFATWNGKNWSLQKIYFSFPILYPGSIGDTLGITSAKSIFVFSDKDIWLAAGTVQHWDGKQWIQFQGDYAGFSNKIWGATTSNMYFVGNNGTIIHNSNGTWQKIESGTSLNFYSLWGSINYQTNQQEILAVGSDVGTAKGSVIMKINNQNASPVSTKGILGNITTIWFIQNRAYYIGSGGLYYKHRLTDSLWQSLTGISQYAVTSIYGNDVNDVFFTSSGGDIVHFNGVNFKSYYNEIGMPQIVYGSVKSNGNILIAVGFLGARAVITIGTR